MAAAALEGLWHQAGKGTGRVSQRGGFKNPESGLERRRGGGIVDNAHENATSNIESQNQQDDQIVGNGAIQSIIITAPISSVESSHTAITLSDHRRGRINAMGRLDQVPRETRKDTRLAALRALIPVCICRNSRGALCYYIISVQIIPGLYMYVGR